MLSNLKVYRDNLKYFKYYKYILLTIFLVFFISANKAWLNPEPNNGAIKINKRIPILWQYIADVKFDLLTSAYFFDYMKMKVPGNVNKFRINRPAIPALNFLISKPIHAVGNLFFNISKIEAAAISFLLVKIFFYITCSLLMFFLIKKYLNSIIAFISVFLFLTHPFMIYHAAHLSIPEFSFFIPIIILFLFESLTAKYTHKKNIYFSILLGILMLAKQAYGIYLAIIIFSLFFKKYKEVLLSIVFHSTPLIIYLLLLKINDIEYYNHEIVCCDAPSWIFNDLLQRPILEIFHVVIFSLHTFTLRVVDFYSIWIFVFLIAIYMYSREKIKNSNNKNQFLLYFLFLLILFTWIQFFAGNRWWVSYMASAEYAIFVYAGSGYLLTKILNFSKKKIRKKIIILFFPLVIFLSTFKLMNFPYEHPYDQKEYLIKNPSLYDKFEN